MRADDSEYLVRFGLFADAHYAETVYGDRHCKDAPAKLRVCIDTFARSGLDFVVCMGDIIDKADDPETERGYLVRMNQIFAGFNGARHFVIGNHDVATLTKEEFLKECGDCQPFYSFDAGGVHFVVLDGNCHEDGRDFSAGNFSWDEAWISTAQLEWLTRDLEANHQRPVLAFCHENVDQRLWQGERDPHILCNAAQVRDVLAGAGNVRALIQAHYHPGILTTLKGIDCIGLRAMAVGEGLENNAYAIVSLYRDGRLVIDGFGQQPSYQL
jgi:predicted phosphodiesterase